MIPGKLSARGFDSPTNKFNFNASCFIDNCIGGVSIFFPSFEYLTVVFNRWKFTGLFARLQSIKAVFSEPRNAAALNEVMRAYSTAATAPKNRGACIACVMGGKLSEGINFNDDLARAVIVIGVPYPNVYSTLASYLRFYFLKSQMLHFCLDAY